MAKQLVQSNSKTAAFVGCSLSAAVRTYQQWFKEGKLVKQQQGYDRQGSLMNVVSEG